MELKNEGLKPIPYEPASYSLTDSQGRLSGIVIVHVDDLMWTGGSHIEEVMGKICQRFNFGKIEKDSFRYCGRDIHRGPDGIRITCSSLIDRVRPIHLNVGQKKNLQSPVTEEVRGQLRSVVGSLAWLARVCRPDLSFGVAHLQGCIHDATYQEVKFANILISVAKKTKEHGLFYAKSLCEFEDLMIVAVQDASHANSFEASGSGVRMGYRSQSGRILCLTGKEFMDTKKGILFPVEWHSTVIKRVSRSTLQSETLSLVLGSEEADHLRFAMYGLTSTSMDEANLIKALDKTDVMWVTDCRSLFEHLTHAGLQHLSDKRLAIDLCALRQMVWRRFGELTGDPLLTDRLPDTSTHVFWTTTDKMIADALTKHMKPGLLEDVMCGKQIDLNPTKYNGCENKVASPWMSNHAAFQ